ncbi:NAD(P)H-dependent oxidoreductase subunit E [Actinacidiphila guanduensis]|uniref:NADH-quinone oxidoreductase subunit F n=1 Tax=Actinacidiphila guanduensis TaxID=310781 RepID=A0A1H0SMX7_9ACTN|nr:NAD(P)H-dependent oxidoreductase subunit E [Actinacidiphila guanduensis]SDP43080.1 NADH-quinone oxidoreductase subunit F [Actinacidiphila guanduensis]
MDLRFTDAKPTDEERAAVDACLGAPEVGWEGGERTAEELRWARGGHAARARRDQLLPALHAVNDRVGWISEGALDYVCRRLTVPPAEGYGVASFYAMFALRPRPARVLHVCTDLACAARGSAALTGALAELLGPPGGAAGGVRWQPSPCLGLCERAPAALAIQAGEQGPQAHGTDAADLADPVDPAHPANLTGSVGPAGVAGTTDAVHPPYRTGPVDRSGLTGPADPRGRVDRAGLTGPAHPTGSASPATAADEAHPAHPAGAHAPAGSADAETAPYCTAVVGPATAGTAELAAVAPCAAPEEPPAAAAVPQAGQDGLVLLRRIGRVDPADLDDYRAQGGYSALRRAFALGPAGVIREVLDAGLVGRGGAAFPTGRKWEATAGRPERTHYLVCNADESEPGTFKDRVLMEGDPYALVEAMTIAGYAVGAHRGYLYLRGEYPRALRRMAHAIGRARARGLLGPDVLGQGYAFDIEIRRGAGAYICGEETAIFNSIEGLRGEPRSKPPFPVERGLFGRPTAVNNVETLVNVLPILERGAAAYASVGTAQSTGTKLFCVSGTVRRPGVYELPFGASLRELVELSGGVPEGRRLRAVLLGGAAGAFVRPDELDIPLTFEGTRAAGATLGSGVVLLLDDTVELPRTLLRIAEFFRDESCGQCVPCRVGTVRQEEALHRIKDLTGAAAAGDIALLREVGAAMRDASICGLGQTAWNAVESAIDRLGVYAGALPGSGPAAGTPADPVDGGVR